MLRIVPYSETGTRFEPRRRGGFYIRRGGFCIEGHLGGLKPVRDELPESLNDGCFWGNALETGSP
jgi:hypothetical protein